MKKRNIILILVLSVVACLTPLSICFGVCLSMPNIYQNTYYAALVDKIDLLKSTKGKKLVLIGGSNVAFGFDGNTLKKHFEDYEIVNFGLYAALGTKLMMDLAKPYLNNGDIAVIIPEINSQSMSLYFSGTETWKAIETKKDLYWAFPENNRETLRGTFLNFNKEKSKYSEPIFPKDVYQRSSFNKYGDIHYGEISEDIWTSKREKNILALHYDPSMMVDYGISVDAEFANYINKYAKALNKKNCSVYYGFAPVNDLSVISNNQMFTKLYWNLRENIDIPIIGSPNEYVFDSHFFYDSNFHLNDAGAVLRSLIFVENYFRDIKGEYLTLKKDYPEMPEYETRNIDTSVNSESAEFFTYEINGDYLEITGVSQEGYNQKEIILPSVANHTLVVGISSNCFTNSLIETIHIPSTIRYIKDGAFGNSLVSKVYMESTDPSSTNISWDGGLVSGVNENFVIYVPNEAFKDYSSNYYWSPYSEYLRRY